MRTPDVKDNRLIDLNACNIDGLPDCWQVVLNQPHVRIARQAVMEHVSQRLQAGATLYPNDPWRALRQLPLNALRVVILGQDPYHGPGQANGLAFSVPNDCATPPSLRHVLQEVAHDVLSSDPRSEFTLQSTAAVPSNDLSRWVDQGVLLLNTALTVEDGQPGSHARIGWATITDAIIQAVATQTEQRIVFMLWGQHAQAKRDLIHSPNHLILCANHPSPLSARRPPVPFIGCGHFRQANEWLAESGGIVW